jgi:hypothetical protein
VHKELPTAAIVLMNIAVVYADKGDIPSAQAWLSKAIPFVPAERWPLVEENLRRLQARSPK